MHLEVTPRLTIPESELGWRFSRSSGPGGQHVNTSDSRVELTWSVVRSRALTSAQRELLLARLEHRLVDGALTVAASEQRSQLRNREAAMARLAELVAGALAPAPPKRLPTRPTRGSARRHTASKTRRSETKRLRRRPDAD
ncbi:aminoacyl-tRNA hydrolase [Leucobacter zeae]|nr:aminoacyl-tRNA hydrolase [Leucobacter zeae]